MSKKFLVTAALLALLSFAIPIEHKYEKLFRFFSRTLIPDGLSISPSYGKKIYFYASDLICLALLFLARARWFFSHPLWIVFICAAVSIALSPFANYPLPYIHLLQLFAPIALFSFLSTAIDLEDRQKIIRVILISLVTAGLFQAAVGIGQYFHQAPLGLRLLGETNNLSFFRSENGSRWLFDLFTHRIAPTKMIRAMGTLPHTNVYGGFLVLSIICTYALSFLTKKRGWIYLSTIPLQLFALCISFSRSALIAWAIATILWLGLVAYQKGLKDPLLRSFSLTIFFSFAAVTLLLFNQMHSRGGFFSYNESTAEKSDQIRHFHQNVAFTILKDHPLFGLGFTQYSERAGSYFPLQTREYVKSTGPHNVFLLLAAETGLISLAAFILFIFLLLKRALFQPMTLEQITFLSLFSGFLFISCCDFYPILFQQGKLMFFLVAGLLALSSKQTNKELSHVPHIA